MPFWIILTLAGTIAVGIGEIVEKRILTDGSKISVESNNFISWLFAGWFSLIFILISGKQLNLSNIRLDTWILFLIVAIIYFIAGSLYYASFKKMSASICVILQSTSVFTSTTLGIIFFHESLTVLKFLGIGIILASVILLHTNEHKKTHNLHQEVLNKAESKIKYIWFSIIAASLFAVAYTFDKQLSLRMDPLQFHFLNSGIFIPLTYLIFKGKSVLKDIPKIFNRNIRWIALLGGFCWFLFNILVLFAYQHEGEVGKVDAINNLMMFWVILFEFVILKDRSDLKRKIFAAILAFIGVYILAMR